ncbi:hypothetical protein NC653_006389 [Populus alba x Populus x berolinensis]|uniref:Uncharacterized protein n=1 Tax=Populus alba x Populus x berolinensis TaxID=444605 RepID=A0AAD6REI0_9ROSI|nr:hypothetical protein NC653_006367 [Populus alba x Populus x berolinensis]KAJ7007329.1 hypothetical protein NC653_006389 [Populus alba x Populus x berolinensis]
MHQDYHTKHIIKSSSHGQSAILTPTASFPTLTTWEIANRFQESYNHLVRKQICMND